MVASVVKRIAGTNFDFGSNTFTVGNGGNFANIDDAVNAIGSRLVEVYTADVATIATNGNPTISFIGITIRTSQLFYVDDLIRLDGGSWHKIKYITNDTTLVLYENFADTSIASTVTVEVYRLARKTLLLLPQEHVSPTAATSLYSGIDIAGTDKFNCVLHEIASSPQSPFLNFGDNNLYNFTFAPGDQWSDFDAIQNTPDPDLWGGARTYIDNMIIRLKDIGGDHGNGVGYFPVPAGGYLDMTNTQVEVESIVQFQACGRVTPTVANTQINIRNCKLHQVPSFRNIASTSVGSPRGIIYGDITATYNISGCELRMDENLAIPSTYDDPAVVYAIGAGTFNINNTIISAQYGATVNGINCPSASTATINLSFVDIDVNAGAGTGTGILTENAGCTVNIRHSRIKGDNSAITNTAGTVNAMQANGTDHGTVTLIGGTTGSITAAET